MHHANLGCESESTTTGALVTEPACLALVVQLVDRVDGEGISIVVTPVAGAAGSASWAEQIREELPRSAAIELSGGMDLVETLGGAARSA